MTSITRANERAISFYSNREALKGARLADDLRSSGIPAPHPSTHSETITEASAKVKDTGVKEGTQDDSSKKESAVFLA
ncbi:MAG: hypothetical protein LBO72_04175 [Helicobacteraceae bacterium]|nr:hypothetical protein [Helicobacteraceae bacterium]